MNEVELIDIRVSGGLNKYDAVITRNTNGINNGLLYKTMISTRIPIYSIINAEVCYK